MIRQAVTEDISKLMALKAKVGKDTYFDYGTPEEFDNWEQTFCSEEYFSTKLDKGAIILVAEYEDVFLGMSSVMFNGSSAYFGDLYCGLQGRGIGSLLTQHRLGYVESHIALQPYGTEYEVKVRCFYQNHRAYTHLLKHGFRPYSWEMHETYPFPTVLMSQVMVNNKDTYGFMSERV
jgi:GNAT superfamily N-acetyltransferase